MDFKHLRIALITLAVTLLLLTIGLQAFSHVASAQTQPTIGATVIIIKGSVWDSDKGKKLVEEQISEANRIWSKEGINLHIPSNFTIADGDPKSNVTNGPTSITARYAKTYDAKADNIIVVFKTKNMEFHDPFSGKDLEDRGWTEPSLVKNDTPVIVIGKEAFGNPGTKRDLAHELCHVLLRQENDYTYGREALLMRQGANIGDLVPWYDVKKAKKYPNNK